MKLTRIAVQSFLGISSLDLAIVKPLVLVAGENCAGKTSIAHSLRFVLLGDLCRVSLKKNIKSLLREGAKLGHVTVGIVNADGEIIEYQRSVVTGNYTSATPPPEPHSALGYLLDPPAFLALSPNERRDFLFRLMGVSLSPPAILEKLEKRGHDPALLARIAPQLRNGFGVAHTEAQGRALMLKGEYRAVTGENWGSVKAESWAAQAPALQSDGGLPLDEELAGLEESIGQAQADLGALRARAEEAARMAKQLTRTRSDAEHVEEYAAVEQALRQSLDGLAAEERKLTEELREAESHATVASHIPQGIFLACPECGAALCYDRGHLKPSKPATAEDMGALANAEQDLASRRQALETLRGTRKTKESELLYATEAVARARSAKETLASFEIGTEPPEETADAILKRLEALKNRREKLRAEIQSREQARAAAAAAKTKTERARQLHEEIKALAALADDLAPDGLPAELLAAALGPINLRLAESAVMTGWARVAVSTDEIHFGDRPLALASDSERWRATAMIAEAIAALSGVKCFVLDGGDVLDVPSRAQCIAWLSAIAHTHETIILLATLKKPPAGLPDSVQLCWLGPPPAMTKAEGHAFDEARVQAAGAAP